MASRVLGSKQEKVSPPVAEVAGLPTAEFWRIPLPVVTMILFFLLYLTTPIFAADTPGPIKHQVTGLFCPERDADLRETVEKIPGLKLLSVDIANAEATFEYDPTKLFPGAKPEQVIERLNNLVRSASFSTFGIKPLSASPKDKLTFVEIAVVGLDCKGCGLAAYEAIAKIDGVERATASFKAGLVTAWIDPAKTDRAALETALKAKGVELKSS